MARLAHLPRTQVAIECGYYTLTRTEDGQLVSEADLESFYEAVLTAKGISSQRKVNPSTTSKIDLPAKLEPYRNSLEATVKPYAEITTHLTREANLEQSKILGFPYFPKSMEYPKTSDGNYLYLLAQINFAEVPHLEGFPEQGVLQFYVAKEMRDGFGYGSDIYNPSNQWGFRVIYFPNTNLPIEDLITDFSFLPNIWQKDKNYDIPFYAYPSYTPDCNDCFILSFQKKYAPMSICHPKFEEAVGFDIWEIMENDYDLQEEYLEKFCTGNKIGGYPHFTQDGPTKITAEGKSYNCYNYLQEDDSYVLLLQIDSDDRESYKINIQWGDVGVCNFWIKESALKRLDFSEVLYYWDCT